MRKFLGIIFGVLGLVIYLAGAEKRTLQDSSECLANSSKEFENFLNDSVRPKLPVKGAPLFNSFDWKNFYYKTFSYADFKIVQTPEQPFKNALRVEVLRKPKNFHTVQIKSINSDAPVQKGDLVFIQFSARCIKSSDESGEGMASVNCVLNSPSWSSICGSHGIFSKEWKTFYGWGRSKNDYAPGKLRLHLFLSQKQQTIEIGGIAILNLGKDVDEKKLPCNIVTYEGREPDSPWRKKAEEMIEKNRKGSFELQILGKDGKPIDNAEIAVEMTRHEYGFGCYVDDHPLLETDSDGVMFRHWFKALFNKATVPLFWGPGTPQGIGYGWENPKYRKNYLSMLKWCNENGLMTHGQVLVWPSFMYAPPDVRKMEGKPQLLQARINDHIRDVLDSTKGRLDELEVVNELYGSRAFTNILGDGAVADWFKLSHSLDPKPVLYMNDNGIVCSGGKLSQPREFYINCLNSLLSQNAPVGGIGFQSHIGSVLTPPEKLWGILDEFMKFGKPIQATEFTLDIKDEELQAEYTRDFYTAFFAHPGTVGIINWGFWAGKHYRPNCAFFRKDWSIKPNGKAYIDLVFNKWRTSEEGISDKSGKYNFRGFFGVYKIKIKTDGLEMLREFELFKHGKRKIEINTKLH